MKVVIIGGGTAGISVATALRRRDENCQIVILEKSSEIATATSALLLFLSGEISNREQLIGATPQQMKQVFNIEVKLGHEVVNIDRKAKKLTITDHEPETYDKLVLATGAITIRPDISGILRDNIFTITDLASVEKIRDYYLGTEAHNVVIVGAGDLGIEAAQAFHKLGAAVTIVEAQSHILSYFDADMTARLQNQLRDNGIRLKVNTLVDEFDEHDAVLDDGNTIAYDLAIIATGVKPDVKLPIMADLDIGQNGGIWVTEHLQTQDPDIYACGDNIELTSLISGKDLGWPSASLTAQETVAAADHLAGNNSLFAPIVGVSIRTIFDYTAAICGLSEHQLKANGMAYRAVHLLQDYPACFLPNAQQMIWKLLFSPEGRILGAQGIGQSGIVERINLVAAVMRQKGTCNDLATAELAYAPHFGAPKDAINNLGTLAQNVVDGQTRYAFIDQLDWEKAGNEIVLIDTRSPATFKQGHIANAINLPLANLRENLGSVPRDKTVVLYCGHGYGAYNAYCLLNQRGFDNVFLLSGAMDLYMEMMLNDIYDEHDDEEMTQVWNRLQFANDDEAQLQ